MSGDAMREAVELATLVQNAVHLPPHVISAAIVGALREHPLRALAGQAALSGAIGRMAEARVGAFLADPELLQVAWMRAEQRVPLTAEAVGISLGALLRDAGLSAAKLRED